MPTSPWLISLHGGHSGRYCDHAAGDLPDFLDAAIAQGCPVYGLTEHAPRIEPHRLYAEEIAMGWDVATLDRLFAEYAAETARLQAAYAGRIEILRGFEAEIVPEGRYVEVMRGFRDRHGFDYLVGSVHWVDGHIIDYTRAQFDAAATQCGGIEALALRYYELLRDMIRDLRPEVVGHFDLVRKNAPGEDAVDTPAIRRAVDAALDAARDTGAILDINTGGYRKGLGRPYPAPWIVQAAHARGIGLCFGDDSHRPDEVLAGVPEARDYLRNLGVDTITTLRRDGSALRKEPVPLD